MKKLIPLAVFVCGCTPHPQVPQHSPHRPEIKSQVEHVERGPIPDDSTYYVVEFRKADGEWMSLPVQPEWAEVRVNLVNQTEDETVFHEIYVTPPLENTP